jgi:hypothetical protein
MATPYFRMRKFLLRDFPLSTKTHRMAAVAAKCPALDELSRFLGLAGKPHGLELR